MTREHTTYDAAAPGQAISPPNAKVSRPTNPTVAGPSQPNPMQGRLTPELSGRPYNVGLGAVLATNPRGLLNGVDIDTEWV